MGEELARSRLGRGLAALIGDADEDFTPPEGARGQRRVPIEFLRRNPRNPRTRFEDLELDELAASIRERGIIQPIVVRPVSGLPDAFEIIAGERRWRAAQRAGLHELPVVVIEADDRAALEIAIIENVQRSDLGALEEAAGYERLIGEHGYSQSDLAATLGKSRSHVANTLRLLKLPAPVREMLERGDLSPGHARALLAVPDPEAVALRVVERGLNVREVERLAKTDRPPPERDDAGTDPGRGEPALARLAGADSDTRTLEAVLQDVLGLRVRIDHRGTTGEVRIRYRSLDQLENLCQRIRTTAA